MTGWSRRMRDPQARQGLWLYSELGSQWRWKERKGTWVTCVLSGFKWLLGWQQGCLILHSLCSNTWKSFEFCLVYFPPLRISGGWRIGRWALLSSTQQIIVRKKQLFRGSHSSNRIKYLLSTQVCQAKACWAFRLNLIFVVICQWCRLFMPNDQDHDPWNPCHILNTLLSTQLSHCKMGIKIPIS